MERSENAPDAVRAAEVRASVARVLRRLPWETHPLLGRDVCALEHEGDVVFLDREEVEEAGTRLVSHALLEVAPHLGHLPDLRLERACCTTLARMAVQSTPSHWRHP